MIKVHATTQKIANKLNLFVSLENGVHLLNGEIELQTICIENVLDESDATGLVTYVVNADGTYTFHSKCTYARFEAEDLPAMVKGEKQLREVIKYLGGLVVAHFPVKS